MNKLYIRFAAVCIVIITLSACVSAPSAHLLANIDEKVKQSDFNAAAALIEQEKDSLYTNTDAVLYYIDTGVIAHFSKDFSRSNELLGIAEQRIQENFTKSVSQGVASFLVNDSVLEYAGEDYEDIYANVFMALNYYHEGKIEDAFVELRRIDNKSKVLKEKYTAFVNEGEKKAQEEYGSAIPYNGQTTATQFYNSALSRYLSLLFYRSIGKYDSAKIDYKFIIEAFEAQKSLYDFPLPKTIADELSIPQEKGRLNIISFTGLAPKKIEEVIRLQLTDEGHYYKLALPLMFERPSQVASVHLVFDSGDEYQMELLEDISAIAIDTFKERQALIYMRSVIRSIAKAASTVVMDSASQNTEDSNLSLLFNILSVGTQVFTEVSERADLRSAHYFPSKAYIAGVTLEPGVYTFHVEYRDVKGKNIYSEYFENVTVYPDGLYLKESTCLK